MYKYIYIDIYASPPPQGLPFKIKSCFQRKVCISDFVGWYSYISNVSLIVFNVMSGSLQGALQWRSSNSLCLIPLLNVSIIIDNVVEKCSLYFKHFIRKIMKQEKHIKCIYSAFLFFGCKNVGLKDLRFTKPAYTQKRSTFWCQKCTKPAYTQKNQKFW